MAQNVSGNDERGSLKCYPQKRCATLWIIGLKAVDDGMIDGEFKGAAGICA